MGNRRNLPLIATLATLLFFGCSPSGTITDDGQGAIPAAGDDVLTVESPEDGSTVGSSNITVTGNAPAGADVVRDVALGRDAHVTATGGTWSMNVELSEGENLLTFRVGDDTASATTLFVVFSRAPVALGSAPPSADAETPSPVAVSPSPDPGPTAEATPSPEPKPLPVRVTKRTASVLRNQTASVTIKTTKGARCMIDVVYSSGVSTAKGLGAKTANGAGSVTWKWRVGGNTTKSTHQIYIWCDKGDRSGSVETAFRVR